MKWLIQEFLNNGSNMERMIGALEACSTEYLLVKLDENDNLTVLDKETKIPLTDSLTVLKKFVLSDDIMVYGSKSFARFAKEIGFTPGSFENEKFEFPYIKDVVGNELLNADFTTGTLFELEPTEDVFFIRPTGNTKLFSGMTVSRKDFFTWKKREEMLGEISDYWEQPLMIAPVKEILAEYRFFVVDQKIITGSSYNANASISEELLAYTQRMIDIFPIAEAFVIDIAQTNQGFKIVEYNNINTSALYNCDEEKIVKAINSLKRKSFYKYQIGQRFRTKNTKDQIEIQNFSMKEGPGGKYLSIQAKSLSANALGEYDEYELTEFALDSYYVSMDN